MGVPLPHPSSCHMELPRPFHPWSGLLTSTTSGSYQHNQPLQALYLPYLLHYPRRRATQEPPPSTPLRSRREASGGGRGPESAERSGEQSGGERAVSAREERQEAPSRRGPLPDVVQRNEQPSWAWPPQGGPSEEALREMEIRRVGSRLRAIGDHINTTVLYRVAAPQWRDWRDACRELFNFVMQILNTFYQFT